MLSEPEKQNQFFHVLLLELEQILPDTRVVVDVVSSFFSRRELCSRASACVIFFSPDLCRLSALSKVYRTAILCLFWKRLSGDDVSVCVCVFS